MRAVGRTNALKHVGKRGGQVRIVGEVHGEGTTARSARAIAHVRVLNVSRSDAAAETVGEGTFGLPADLADDRVVVPFDLEVDDHALNPRGSYVLAAHIDFSGDGTVSKGDFVTTRSIPLRRGESISWIDVPLQQV